MAIITPSDLSFNGEEVREFAEAVIERTFEDPALNEVHLIMDDIVAKQQIVLIGRLSKITKKDAGCGQGKTSPTIPMSEKFWNPVQLKIWLSECHTQFDQTFMVYYKKKGKEYPDLTQTEIFSMFLIDQVGIAAAMDALRIAWFADTAAKTVTNGGSFTDGTDLTDYTMLDGFWKQLFAVAAANAKRKTAIAKNAGASYTAQTFDAADVTAKVATKVFQGMIFKADTRLRGEPTKRILATRSLTDQYILERLDSGTELAYTRLESGIDTLNILGVPVIVMDIWDRTITADQDNGTKWNLPHRAVMTLKENLPLGIDEEQALGDFDVFYDKMSETSNIKGGYKYDAKVIEDYMVQVAY